MTIQDRIVEYLSHHPEGVDDDHLATALALRQRQQANQRCRRLAQFGFVLRRAVDGKIRNFLNPETPPPRQGSPPVPKSERPWYWEGNVQSAVAQFLTRSGYEIKSLADTAKKQQGKDILAVAPDGLTLWVSAKGYPEGTVRTNPRTQARHWFAHALFDLILWHGEDASSALALALPEQKTYRNLAYRAGWFLAGVGARVFWVAENGAVQVEVTTMPSKAAATTG